MGEERKGLMGMFQMMNSARLSVAVQGLAISSSAYMHAVTYAKNRIQGKDSGNKSKEEKKSVPIIKHQDIKRTLLWMKSHVEAMRMLTSFGNYCVDISHVEQGEAAKEALAVVEFLNPICKAGNAENAWLITAEAIQIHGGYGFCSDYRVEQLARDSKICSLYEGTKGIIANDLTLRKLLKNQDLYNYSVYRKKINETIDKARGIVDEKYISLVKAGIEKMDDTVKYLKSVMDSGNSRQIDSKSVPLLLAFSMLSYAWMHLWSLSLCIPKLKEITGDAKGEDLENIIKNNVEAAFYHGKILSARFYIGSEFNKFFGQVDYLLSDETAVIEAMEEIFTGAPEE
jgi:hypothetical protein